MKENAKQRYSDCGPLPPQFFNGGDYCGDYEDFDEMNDDNKLYQFLKLTPPPTSKKVRGSGQIRLRARSVFYEICTGLPTSKSPNAMLRAGMVFG